MKSTSNSEYSINMGKKPKKTYKIEDNLDIGLGYCSTKNNEYFSFDLFDNQTTESFETYMSRDKLRGLAVFILNYLEHN